MEHKLELSVEDARSEARKASQLGLLSMGMVILTPCYCYLLSFLALPMGIYALVLSDRVKDHAADPEVKAYRETANFAGAMGLVFALGWILLALMYMLMVVVTLAVYVVVVVVYIVIILFVALIAVISGA